MREIKKLQMKQLKITLKRSYIGKSEAQRRVLQSLGLKKVNQQVFQNDTPSIRGMIRKVPHLIEVKEA